MMVDIYPPSLREKGLESALLDLTASLEQRGIATELEAPSGLELTAETEAVLYRVAQEAVRNAARHADPTHVTVAVDDGDGRVSLTVTDDGRGLPGEASSPSGHFGMQLMRDLAADAGGELEVEPGPNGGTRVRLEVPTT
jgi:signal transduction histidine kinase